MQGRSSCLLPRRSSLVVLFRSDTVPEVDRDLMPMSRYEETGHRSAESGSLDVKILGAPGGKWGGAQRKVKSLIDGQHENRKGVR